MASNETGWPDVALDFIRFAEDETWKLVLIIVVLNLGKVLRINIVGVYSRDYDSGTRRREQPSTEEREP